jgi:hypothetical protein
MIYRKGWTVGKCGEDGKVRVISPEGVGIPLAQGIGTLEQQKAKLAYDRWRLDQLSQRLEKLRPMGKGGKGVECCSAPPLKYSAPDRTKVDHDPQLAS